MTIDEAIAYALEMAGEQQERADSAELIDILDGLDVEACKECAADHRQLAEWLRQLKDLREENKVLMQECDRLIKEKGELLNKVSGGDVLRICRLEEQLEKAKRLLKVAVEDFDNIHSYLSEPYSHICEKRWRYADEALKLLNDEK